MTISASSNPLVSVIMPVYNHGEYVAEALLSIVRQNWRPLEIIIIDDGSTDNSFEVLQKTVDSLAAEADVAVYVSSRENRGAHTTINEGLRAAKGEFLAILNSDDYYLPGRIRKCVETALSQSARFVFTYVEPIDDDGLPLAPEHRWRQWYADLKMQELDLAPSISTLLLRYNIGVSTGNFFFHRSLLEDVGYFRDYRYAHDLDFMLRVSNFEEPVIIREKTYAYRVHANNTIGESNDLITNEVASIVAEYIKSTFEQEPANQIAARFDRNCYYSAITPWPPHLEKAIDSLMYDASIITKYDNLKHNNKKSLVRAPQATSNRQKITLISHELSRTGAPVLLRDVASALHELGVATRVISLGDGPLKDDYTAMNSPVVTEGRLAHALGQAGGFLARLSNDNRVPNILRPLLAFSAKISSGVGARLRMLRYHAKVSGKGSLLVNSFASWPLALPLLEKWQGPAFWYIHETYEPSLVMRSGRHLKRLRTLAEQKRVTFLFGSDATRQHWAKEGYDGEVFYWSGMTAAVEMANPAVENEGKTRIILSVQSTGPRKGTWSLIEGFAYGCRQGFIPEDVHLHIIGAHPPSKNALNRDLLVRILQDDIRGRVHLIPNLAPNELGHHYRNASIYVQSSTMECLPLALLNAMACKLPIVSTDADGCREAIINGETGLLIPSRQSKMMGEALGALLNDENMAARLADNARKRFETMFALEVTAPKLVNRISAAGSLYPT